ncbi:hypothetical protein AALB52_07375 [Lachnospiraceae bacterium 38-14]|nr:hypothetical protein [Roseburia sp. 1XD42-69]MCX4318980.1 hypothetical protein [Lachnospiraceae bacterium]
MTKTLRYDRLDDCVCDGSEDGIAGYFYYKNQNHIISGENN